MRATDSYAAAEVLSTEGVPVELRSLWAEGTVIIVFLRHFG
jgi:hypothetical protein